ncbi:3-oxoacyl-ACP synthase [Nocardia sp. MDA0666]|uniref:beta-ketoacyl synthase N-terminal-like domain-containing protein n=1 Tax=Nocardia sp. MDA0666 TaxID=2135448 RepID=UPI000D127D6A|nr:beta-ketoacyl synthase N-terminal-like domain-containing protein [Nocardia sp. MDA0666]PSR68655.1 3-oxoacyl-ACP synthase [Nocardia sp. MDA0666]
MKLVFTGCSVLSPYGTSTAEFGNGIRSGISALRPVGTGSGELPIRQAGLVADFDVRKTLGAKGTRSMDRVTGLAVEGVRQILDRLPGSACGADTAVVLGTTTGSVRSMMEFVGDSYLQDKPYQVDPARFPNAVMNRAAGQCAIWHGVRGPNATIAGGRAAGAAVLQYAERLFDRDRARTVLCGMVEEFSPHRTWVEYLAAGRVDRPIGEGCAVFVLEPAHSAAAAGRGVLAELVGLEHGVWGRAAPVRDVLSRLLRSALACAGISGEEVALIAVAGSPGTDPWEGFSAGEYAAARDVLPHTTIRSIADLVGDCGAATGGLQLAALLGADYPPGKPYAFFTSVDLDGAVGCVLIRRDEPGGEF